MLDQLADAVADAAARIGPAVVGVGRGTGFVIARGQVLTNAHNLVTDPVVVRFAGGRAERAPITASDTDGDLAVLAVDTEDLDPLQWADSPPATGTPVLAVATTRSNRPRVTFGLVSADGQGFRGPRGRRIRGAVEHTAPLGRGSSGGPVVGLDGRLLAINTHRRGDGFYLAQPVTAELRERIERLTRGESPRAAHLGVAVASPQVAHRLRAAVGLEERDGVLVRDVNPDGPAGRAGVRRGDLVVAADGAPVTSPDDMLDRLDEAEDALTLTLVRGADEVELRVDLDGSTQEEGSA